MEKWSNVNAREFPFLTREIENFDHVFFELNIHLIRSSEKKQFFFPVRWSIKEEFYLNILKNIVQKMLQFLEIEEMLFSHSLVIQVSRRSMRGRILSDPNNGYGIRWSCCRIPFSRNPTRIASEIGGFRRNSDRIWSAFIGFRQIPMKSESDSDWKESTTILSDPIGFLRKLSDSDEIRRGSDRFGSNLPVGLDHLGSKRIKRINRKRMNRKKTVRKIRSGALFLVMLIDLLITYKIEESFIFEVSENLRVERFL